MVTVERQQTGSSKVDGMTQTAIDTAAQQNVTGLKDSEGGKRADSNPTRSGIADHTGHTKLDDSGQLIKETETLEDKSSMHIMRMSNFETQDMVDNFSINRGST